MDNQFNLRRADISDADALSQLCQNTYRETFIEDLSISYPENDVDSYFRSSASQEWFTNKIVDPKIGVWLIEDRTNNELVAYAVAGPCDGISHPDVQPNLDGSVYRLYVRRDQHNHGFGKHLMNVILHWLEEHYPRRPIWLTAFSNNLKAQKFYSHYGFSKVGDINYYIGEWKDHDFIMKRQSNTNVIY
jgi:ribosomal protein S18 acetylase RimI-like enzyme